MDLFKKLFSFFVSFVPLVDYGLIFLIFWFWDLSGHQLWHQIYCLRASLFLSCDVIISSYIFFKSIITHTHDKTLVHKKRVYTHIPLICCFANTFSCWDKVSCCVDQVPQRTEPGWFHESPWLHRRITPNLSISRERKRGGVVCHSHLFTPSLLSVKPSFTRATEERKTGGARNRSSVSQSLRDLPNPQTSNIWLKVRNSPL